MRELHAILATSFSLWTSWAAFGPIFPLFVNGLGFSLFNLGILMAIPSFLAIFLRIPTGGIASRIGGKRLVLFALALQSLSLILLSFLSDLNSLFVIRLLSGIALSFFPPMVITAIYDLTTPTSKGKMFGLFFTSLGLAAISGPLVGSLLLQFLDFSSLFMVLSLFPAVGFIIYFTGSSDNQALYEKHNSRVSLMRVLGNRNVLALCSCRVLFAITASMFAMVFPIYAGAVLMIAPSLVSAMFMIRGISNTLSRLPSGRISDRIGRKKPIILAYVILVGVFIFFSETNDFLVFTLIMFIYGFAWGLRVAPETALVVELVGREDASSGIALLSTMFPIGSTIGSILAGWLASTFSIPAVLKLSSLIIVAAIVFFLTISEAKPSTKKAPVLLNEKIFP